MLILVQTGSNEYRIVQIELYIQDVSNKALRCKKLFPQIFIGIVTYFYLLIEIYLILSYNVNLTL